MENTARNTLYTEVTQRIISELEQGRLPWVQPWDTSLCGCTMPHNAATDRRYSGINVLILWAEVVMRGYGSQRWLTYRQAQAAGGNVRKGEKGTTVCYADRFTPKAEAEQARGEDREARTVAFLKRFTVFNIDQCEGLPEAMTAAPVATDPVLAIAEVDAIIIATGATFNIGGDAAFYSPAHDFVQVPPQDAQLAREIEFALPREMTQAQAIELARDFVRVEFVDRGMIADLNVHWDIGADGEAKPHAHVMLTMREIVVGEDGSASFGAKVRCERCGSRTNGFPGLLV